MKSSIQHSIRQLLLIVFIFTNMPAFSAVKVAGIFSDNMVLQRGMNVPVWGTANGGEKVTVTIGGFSCTTVTPVTRNWKVYLQPFEAGGPHELVVKGENEIRFKDVLFGEVWVASGQSNMQWTLESSNNGAEEVKNANYADIRLFYVPRRAAYSPKTDLEGGKWEKCTPESAKGFSGVAYFFGRDLYKELNVPIGLINCNWGGTVAEAWTSSEMLKSLADFKGKMIELEQGPNWEEDLAANDEHAKKKQDIIDNSYKGLEQGILKANYNVNDWPVVIAPNWEEKLNGVVWLRRMIEIPAEFKGKELRFDLGRLENFATVYFNETRLGTVNSPNFGAFTVPGNLVKAGKNAITVRLVHRWGNPNFTGPVDNMKLIATNGAILEDLSGPWKYKTGLEPEFPEVKSYQNYQASLYNGMLYPIIPYGIQGVIWYQGESNAGRAYQYQSLFQSMIEDWRIQWGQGYFPFLYVQLANYMDIPNEPGDDNWAELREAQTMALRLPNTGMAVITDIGERFDIHPRNKQDVGYRLALAAKKVAYGKDVVFSGPMYTGMEIIGLEIRISFDYVANGLMAKGEKLKGFQIAGADRKWYWADAQIVGGKVYVTSEKVKQPAAVRYGWSINSEANLFNKNGLPASPFRTDDWPGITVDVK